MKHIEQRPLIGKLNKIYRIGSHPFSFVFIVLSIVGWFIIGAVFHYDESWYKWFHIYEMCITLTMIFVIESTQQEDDKATQAKLDEIIRAIPKANDKHIALERKLKGEIN